MTEQVKKYVKVNYDYRQKAKKKFIETSYGYYKVVLNNIMCYD